MAGTAVLGRLTWLAADVAALRHINPAGKIPALVLPDGTAVCESAAILIYLSTAHREAQLAPPPGSTAHARFLQWMVFLSANVYDAALRYYHAERVPIYDSAGVNDGHGDQDLSGIRFCDAPWMLDNGGTWTALRGEALNGRRADQARFYALGDDEPDIDESAFVHPDAVVIGRVRIGPEASVWPCAALSLDSAAAILQDVPPQNAVSIWQWWAATSATLFQSGRNSCPKPMQE